MGRSRTKSKKTNPSLAKPAPDQPKPAPSVPALLEKSRQLLVQCDYDLARKFIERILQSAPGHVEASEMLGVVQLETGDLDSAKQTFSSLLTSSDPPPPAAHLYLAQLSDDDPHLALKHYQAAVDILVGQIKGKERAVDASTGKDEETLKTTAVQALISMVEIWMDPSYDLCDAPEAEQTCENLLHLALQIDPDHAEALQTLASVRLSQQRPDDAKEILEKALSKWKDLEPDDEAMPSIETRLSLVKLLLELSLFKPALEVLQGIIATDDQSVDAWYLEGWCFFLMAEQARESGVEIEGLSWMDLARDARDCLEMYQKLHSNEEDPDLPMAEHVKELIDKLQVLGVEPSEEGADEDEEGWEDVEGSEDDSDVEMS